MHVTSNLFFFIFSLNLNPQLLLKIINLSLNEFLKHSQWRCSVSLMDSFHHWGEKQLWQTCECCGEDLSFRARFPMIKREVRTVSGRSSPWSPVIMGQRALMVLFFTWPPVTLTYSGWAGGPPCSSSDHINNSTPHPLTVGNHKLSEADAQYLLDILHLHRCRTQSIYDKLLFLLTLVAIVDKIPEQHLSATRKSIPYTSRWNSINFMTNQLILWWNLTW